MRDRAGRGKLLGQHSGKALGQDSLFPAPTRQHPGLDEHEARLRTSAFLRVSQLSHFSELMQEDVTLYPILAAQGPQP